MSLGAIVPGQRVATTIVGESGLSVLARTPAGDERKSEEIYFSSGWGAAPINVTVTNDDILLEHNFLN